MFDLPHFIGERAPPRSDDTFTPNIRRSFPHCRQRLLLLRRLHHPLLLHPLRLALVEPWRPLPWSDRQGWNRRILEVFGSSANRTPRPPRERGRVGIGGGTRREFVGTNAGFIRRATLSRCLSTATRYKSASHASALRIRRLFNFIHFRRMIACSPICGHLQTTPPNSHFGKQCRF